jgi:hypothetical protein
MALNDIIPLLAGLSAQELDNLAARIKALRAITGSASQDGSNESGLAEPDVDFVVHCAHQAAVSAGAELSTYFQLRQVAKRSADFRTKAANLILWLKPAGNRSRQRALLCLAYQLLYRDMTENGYPVTARTLLNHTHRLPSLVEKDFPGYYRAGLLDRIV